MAGHELQEIIGSDLHTSVSQLRCFMLCPRQFELKYVRGLEPAFTPRALSFGVAFHAAHSDQLGHPFRVIWDTLGA